MVIAKHLGVVRAEGGAPVSVDKSNYEKELIQGGYYTADQIK